MKTKLQLYIDDYLVLEDLEKQYDYEKRPSNFRQAVRAVVIRNGKIAVQHVPNGFNGEFYMLPGGGVDYGESIEQALKREVKEEAAARVEITAELGNILEVMYRPEKGLGLIQLNHGYLCEFKEDLGDPDFTDMELEKGMRLIWLEIEDAIQKIRRGNEGDYTNYFTRKRDSKYLEIALELV